MKLVIDIDKNLYKVVQNAVKEKINVSGVWVAIADGEPYEESPQGECDNCDYRKFTEQFFNGVFEVMNKNGITSIEELQERLKGGAE